MSTGQTMFMGWRQLQHMMNGQGLIGQLARYEGAYPTDVSATLINDRLG